MHNRFGGGEDGSSRYYIRLPAPCPRRSNGRRAFSAAVMYERFDCGDLSRRLVGYTPEPGWHEDDADTTWIALR